MKFAARPTGDYYQLDRNLYGLARLGGIRLDRPKSDGGLRFSSKGVTRAGLEVELQVTCEFKHNQKITIYQLYAEVWKGSALVVAARGVAAHLPQGYASLSGLRRASIGSESHDLLAWAELCFESAPIFGKHAQSLCYWHTVDFNTTTRLHNDDLGMALLDVHVQLDRSVPGCRWVLFNADHPSLMIADQQPSTARLVGGDLVEALCRKHFNRLNGVARSASGHGATRKLPSYGFASAISGAVLGFRVPGAPYQVAA